MVSDPPLKCLVGGGREDPTTTSHRPPDQPAGHGVFARCGVLSSRVRVFGRGFGRFRGS